MSTGIGVGVSHVFGGGPPFTPSELSPVLWLDASDASTVTASSGSVSQWTDKSTNAYTFTQATAANQPSWGSRTQNGLNVMDFDGTNDLLVSTAASSTWNFLHNGTDYLVAAVVARDLTTSSMAVMTTHTSATGIGVAWRLLSGNSLSHVVGNGGGLVVDNVVQPGLSTAARVITMIASPSAATAANRSRVTVDGGAVTGNNAQTGAVSTSNPGASLTLGNRQSSALPLNGFIAELIIVTGSHVNELRRLQLRDYLDGKWGAY